MFSKGQLIFATIFVLIFFSVLFFAYRKDKKSYQKLHYGKEAMVVGFLIVMMIVGFITLRIIIH